jgi:hypothetical protein
VLNVVLKAAVAISMRTQRLEVETKEVPKSCGGHSSRRGLAPRYKMGVTVSNQGLYLLTFNVIEWPRHRLGGPILIQRELAAEQAFGVNRHDLARVSKRRVCCRPRGC